MDEVEPRELYTLSLHWASSTVSAASLEIFPSRLHERSDVIFWNCVTVFFTA